MNDDENTNVDQTISVLRERVEREPERAAEAPRESDAWALARHRDPSLTTEATKKRAAKKARPGVEWVRPSDLMASRSARMAGRGIDLQAELARRARRVPGQAHRVTGGGARSGARFVSGRARKLPPVTALGRTSEEPFSWVSRPGIGLR